MTIISRERDDSAQKNGMSVIIAATPLLLHERSTPLLSPIYIFSAFHAFITLHAAARLRCRHAHNRRVITRACCCHLRFSSFLLFHDVCLLSTGGVNGWRENREDNTFFTNTLHMPIFSPCLFHDLMPQSYITPLC